MAKIPLPIDAVMAITYRCNSRCIMCNIWKMTDHNEMDPVNFLKIPSTLKDINISGGEPFLNPNIIEIIKNIKKICPKARLIISSNGFLTDVIKNRMIEILKIDPQIGVTISLDGVGEKHTEIRRIPDGFNKCLSTIKMLKSIGVKKIKIGFTVQKENFEHLSKIYDLTRELGIELSVAMAQTSDFYFQATNNLDFNFNELEKQFSYIITQELKSWAPKRWARAFFDYGLLFLAKNKKQILPSPGAHYSFYLDPTGNIYPSVVHNKIMGNITKNNFKNIWESNEADIARQFVDSGKIQTWMICTARASMKKHPLKPIVWIIKNKIKTLFGQKIC